MKQLPQTTYDYVSTAEAALVDLHDHVLHNEKFDSAATQYALAHINEALIQLDYVVLALENK